MITGKLYDYMKWAAQVVLPATGTLYVGLAALWGLPEPQAVAGTILAVDTFLGVLLGVSQVNYGKQISEGVMHVYETENTISHSLVVEDPETLGEMKEVRLRVVKG